MQKQTILLLHLALLLVGMTQAPADAQIVQPVPLQTIQQTRNAIEAFSMGMGDGVANYMCFEALKGNLNRATRNNILDLYQQWFDQQRSYQIESFIKGFNLEVSQFNQVYPSNRCPFVLS